MSETPNKGGGPDVDEKGGRLSKGGEDVEFGVD